MIFDYVFVDFVNGFGIVVMVCIVFYYFVVVNGKRMEV